MQKNAVVGIVAEYNPFHEGHAWMLRTLRGAGAGTLVCVMSGSFVQRAEAALLPAHLRAEAAVAGGADLVLRLPLPWATASAERFAGGAVGLLHALGCVDTLAFGAETPDADALLAVAEIFGSAEFKTALQQALKTGVSFAAARAAAAETVRPGAGALLASPNNILGIEYCKALLAAGPGAPRPLALGRHGAQHDGAPRGGIASASHLRAQVWAGERADIEALGPYVPAACMPIYRRAAQTGQLLCPPRWDFALLARLRGKSAQQFARCASAGEGLEARVALAAKQHSDMRAVYAAAKTKRFAHSRVRRLCLEAALELPAEVPAAVPFAQVLAANGRGLALLRRIKGSAGVPVSTSLARLQKTSPAAAALIAQEAAAEDLYSLCLQSPRPGGASYTQAASFQL